MLTSVWKWRRFCRLSGSRSPSVEVFDEGLSVSTSRRRTTGSGRSYTESTPDSKSVWQPIILLVKNGNWIWWPGYKKSKGSALKVRFFSIQTRPIVCLYVKHWEKKCDYLIYNCFPIIFKLRQKPIQNILSLVFIRLIKIWNLSHVVHQGILQLIFKNNLKKYSILWHVSYLELKHLGYWHGFVLHLFCDSARHIASHFLIYLIGN